MIKLRCVTMTGADEDTDISRMIYLSRRYPFVEWGILISATRSGYQNRYPCKTWIQSMIGEFHSEKVSPRLAYHVCGKLASSLFSGLPDPQWEEFVPSLEKNVSRVQINVNLGRVKKYNPNQMMWLLRGIGSDRDRQCVDYIFQYNRANSNIWSDLVDVGMMPHILFDASGGRGILPENIQRPITGLFCGYAGGLNPQNCQEFLTKLNDQLVVGTTWIDMESGVRDDQDKFDLDKVEDVLEICEPYTVLCNRRSFRT